jgi:hypothetical protein
MIRLINAALWAGDGVRLLNIKGPAELFSTDIH